MGCVRRRCHCRDRALRIRRHLRAGIGDALSKQYEVCFNTRGRILNHTNNLGVQIAKDCSERLLQYGVKALDDAQKNIVSDEFIQTVLTIIVNTGLVSVLVNLNYLKTNG